MAGFEVITYGRIEVITEAKLLFSEDFAQACGGRDDFSIALYRMPSTPDVLSMMMALKPEQRGDIDAARAWVPTAERLANLGRQKVELTLGNLENDESYFVITAWPD